MALMLTTLSSWPGLSLPSLSPPVVRHFPLGVRDLRFENSALHVELQLVDIVAGAFATLSRNRIEPDYRSAYAARLRAVVSSKFIIGVVWPSTDVELEALGTTGGNVGDPIDLISELLRRAKAKKTSSD